MSRWVTVTNELDEYAGRFDASAAERWVEGCTFDGRNHISCATGSEWDHESLYRTKTGGRWVVRSYSDWQGAPDFYRFVSPEDACRWLVVNGDAGEAERLFGELAEEGPELDFDLPDVGGRPPVGPAFSLRVPPWMLERVDERAHSAGITRAAMLRQLVEAGLAGSTL